MKEVDKERVMAVASEQELELHPGTAEMLLATVVDQELSPDEIIDFRNHIVRVVCKVVVIVEMLQYLL